MRTPHEFQIYPKNCEEPCQDGALHDVGQQRECLNCGKPLPPGSSTRKLFGDDQCRGQYTQNLRSAIRHVRSHLSSSPQLEFMVTADQSVDILAVHFLESLPSTRTARQEMIWRELGKMDDLMLTVGPIDPRTRQWIRTRATAIATVIRRLGFRDQFDRRLFIHTRELFRDVGIESPFTSKKRRELLQHAEAAVSFFVEQKRDLANMLNLCRALMAWGNVLRILGDERSAAPRFSWVYRILLEGPCRIAPQDGVVAWYFHQARSWLLRMRGETMTGKEQETEIVKMAELAEQVNDPRLWVQHHRDAAAYATLLMNDPAASLKHIEDMRRRRKSLSSQYMDVTLLRPSIELLFATDHTEEAIELVRTEYVRLYAQHRDKYYFDLLQNWLRQYMFEFRMPLPRPEYLSPILTFFPRHLASPLV